MLGPLLFPGLKSRPKRGILELNRLVREKRVKKRSGLALKPELPNYQKLGPFNHTGSF